MMRLWSELRERAVALFRGSQADADLAEELEFHMEMEAAANLKRGLSPEEALRRARLKLGSVDRFSEESRDERGARGLLDIGRDVRLSLRGLTRSALFTGVVVLTLALGIGATTAVFGLVNRMLLRPTPGVERADELVLVQMQEDEYNWTGLSYPNFVELRAAASAFTGFAGYTTASLHVASEPGAAEVMLGSVVVGDYFGTLGVQPAQGRFFTEAEQSGMADPFVIVLSARAAERLFAQGRAVGRTLRANGHAFTVIGVAPREFRGVERMRHDDAWLPPAAYTELRHMTFGLFDRRPGLFREFFGRLRDDATASQAQEQLRAQMNRLIAAYPEENAIYESHPPTVFESAPGMSPYRRQVMRTTFGLLFGVSLLVLLIACANVANLLVFRGVVRRGETAVRRALGASSWRLLQQHFAEGLLLATMGAACGVIVASALTRYLAADAVLGAAADLVAVDWRVLAFTGAVALVVSIAFAAVPALLTRRLDLVGALRQTNRGETGRLGWTRGGLVVVQLAASVALLVVSLLFGRTVRALSDVELGFDPARVVAFGVSHEEQGYDDDRRRLVERQLLEQAAALPEVQYAALTASPPFSGVGHGGSMRLPEWDETTQSIRTSVQWGTADYFRALDVPLLRGRGFTPAESSDPLAGAAVLNRTAAERLFGTLDVIGRTFIGGFGRAPRTVIGVVDDSRHGDIREAVPPTIYLPQATNPLDDSFYLLVRTRGAQAAIEPDVRRILARIEPDLPFFRVQLLAASVREAIARERFLGRVTAVLAGIAGLLAAIGLYGLLAYAVAQRTREIGVRIALGARPSRIVQWVTQQMLVLVLLGIAIGLGAGAGLGRIIQNQLFGVTPSDPAANLIAAGALLLVGLLAAVLPARTAVRVPPGSALRTE